MSAPFKRCPNPACACPVELTDVFCPHCGGDLAPLAASGERFPSDIPKLEEATQRIDQMEARALASTSEIPTESRASSDSESSIVESDCKDLVVRYNNSCVFVMNMQSTFDFEIRPRVDGVKNLSIEIQQSGRSVVRERPMAVAKRGVVLPVSLNYTPQTAPGNVSFTLVVEYRLNGRRHLFAASHKHTIYSGKEDPRSVCENLVVEVKNNIHQGHAGDVKVDQNFHALKDLLGRRDGLALDKEFIDLISGRAFWAPLSLAECSQDTGGTAFFTRPIPSQMVFKPATGPEVDLFYRARLQIGRNRDCDLVARVVGRDGLELREATTRISRYHACLEWQEDRLVVIDHGFYPGERDARSSAAGVWVNGKRIASGGSSALEPGQDYKIALDDPESGGHDVYTMSIRLWTVLDLPKCGCLTPKSSHEIACAVVRPPAHSGKVVVLLNRGFCLGWVDTHWKTACLCSGENHLRLCDGVQNTVIRPGQEVVAAGTLFQVFAPHRGP